MIVDISIDAGDIFRHDEGHELDHIGKGCFQESDFRKLLAYILRIKRPAIDELLGYMEKGEYIALYCSYGKDSRDARSSKV